MSVNFWILVFSLKINTTLVHNHPSGDYYQTFFCRKKTVSFKNQELTNASSRIFIIIRDKQIQVNRINHSVEHKLNFILCKSPCRSDRLFKLLNYSKQLCVFWSKLPNSWHRYRQWMSWIHNLRRIICTLSMENTWALS